MYTVTFYSFKGGTGRSMALANVAIELAKRGRRVLIVDFDLEAPGLDTFRIGDNSPSSLGLVDYIHEYLRSGAPPNLDNYLYETTFHDEIRGKVWVMPAGKQDQGYDNQFRAIDWQDLYDTKDGFLLFENLKADWQQKINPDYVLIDSRTGHTDVGGICTRQLPDCVVIFFFPNEQNRRGLELVVREIRAEETGPLEKSIEMHFVMANVPDLDDEEEILAANLQRIRETLHFNQPTAIIHHYNSLALLNQAIFTLERPKSRLAQEYGLLTSAIVRGNLEDPEGALEFLDESLRQVRNRALPNSSWLERKLGEIRTKHANNGEVLRRLARLRARQVKTQEAIALLTTAIDGGFVDSDMLLTRAQLNVSSNKEAAFLDLKRLFQLPNVPSLDITVALRLLRRVEPSAVGTVMRSAIALDGASVDFELTKELEASTETLPIAEKLLRRWDDSTALAGEKALIRNELVVCLIGQGQFRQAKDLCAQGRVNPNDFDIDDSYNYAMSEWALTDSIPLAFLQRVFVIHSKRQQPSTDPNYLQCIAITAWALGDSSTAMIYLSNAGLRVHSGGNSIFSTWSYLTVSPDDFMREVNEMRALFMGKPGLPQFIMRARQTTGTLQ